jgi:hypothetical protein
MTPLYEQTGYQHWKLEQTRLNMSSLQSMTDAEFETALDELDKLERRIKQERDRHWRV